MRRTLSCLLAALLLLLMPAAALASARMPSERGVVTDDADVLGAQLMADIAEYAEMAEDETDIRLHVAVVHFLDGLDAQTYASGLFEKWALGGDDMLLLCAAGEDSFAAAMGEDVAAKLGKSNAENLLYTSSDFATLFRSQRYDEALGAYFVALNALVNRQTGADIDLGDLFEAYREPEAAPTQAPTAQSYASELWNEVMSSIQESNDDYQVYHETRRNEDNGIGVGGWLVLIVIIMILFGQSDPARRARKRGNMRRMGCGCSPLGWIVSLLGLNVFFDLFRRR